MSICSLEDYHLKQTSFYLMHYLFLTQEEDQVMVNNTDPKWKIQLTLQQTQEMLPSTFFTGSSTAAEILALFPKFGRASKRERRRRGENSVSIGEEWRDGSKQKKRFVSLH